jgi:regulatory protein
LVYEQFGHLLAGLFLIMEHRITSITAQKRNRNRVNVFLDGDYAFSLATIVAAWLRKEQMIDDSRIELLLKDDSEEKAFQKALAYIGYRPRSEFEVKARLEKAGFDSEVIAKTMAKLIASNMLGDAQFSRMWLENRANSHPRSHRLMAMELKRKGVESDQIEEALVDLPEDRKLAFEAGKKYARRMEDFEEAEFKKKMLGFLARKGFSYGVIQEVLPMIWNDIKSKNGASMGANSDE